MLPSGWRNKVWKKILIIKHVIKIMQYTLKPTHPPFWCIFVMLMHAYLYITCCGKTSWDNTSKLSVYVEE